MKVLFVVRFFRLPSYIYICLNELFYARSFAFSDF
jgi:hypothetical protein